MEGEKLSYVFIDEREFLGLSAQDLHLSIGTALRDHGPRYVPVKVLRRAIDTADFQVIMGIFDREKMHFTGNQTFLRQTFKTNEPNNLQGIY